MFFTQSLLQAYGIANFLSTYHSLTHYTSSSSGVYSTPRSQLTTRCAVQQINADDKKRPQQNQTGRCKLNHGSKLGSDLVEKIDLWRLLLHAYAYNQDTREIIYIFVPLRVNLLYILLSQLVKWCSNKCNPHSPSL